MDPKAVIALIPGILGVARLFFVSFLSLYWFYSVLTGRARQYDDEREPEKPMNSTAHIQVGNFPQPQTETPDAAGSSFWFAGTNRPGERVEPAVAVPSANWENNTLPQDSNA